MSISLVLLLALNAGAELMAPQPLGSQAAIEVPTLLGLRVGVDDFASVQRRLGPATITAGTLPGEKAVLCYRSDIRGDDTVLILASQFEGPGVENRVFFIRLRAASSGEVERYACAPSREVSRSTTTSSGIYLGMPSTQAVARLGTGVSSSGQPRTVARRDVLPSGARTYTSSYVFVEAGKVTQLYFDFQFE